MPVAHTICFHFIVHNKPNLGLCNCFVVSARTVKQIPDGILLFKLVLILCDHH